MDIKRSLTTAYHPQADGQTEIMNQTLEVALRTYVNPSLSDWSTLLDPFALMYNNTLHSATSFPPSFLLFGFLPLTPNNLLQPFPDLVSRPAAGSLSIPLLECLDRSDSWPHIPERDSHSEDSVVENDEALALLDQFETYRNIAKQSLHFSQISQQKNYNKGHLIVEFNVGDSVLLNPHSLNLLRSEKRRRRKLLMKYDSPFEILQRLGPTTYRLRLPTSYGIHPILNVAHLKPYVSSDSRFGPRPSRHMNRTDFTEVPEYEVDTILRQ